MRVMMVTKRPSFIVAKALGHLVTFYWMWERDRGSKYPELRRFALSAKTHGIVAHDRTLNISSEVQR